MNVQITPAARERMRNFVASEANAIGVRFGVRKMGCSGFAYTMDVAGEIRDGDIVEEGRHQARRRSRKACRWSKAREIDFAREGSERDLRVPQSECRPASAAAAKVSR